MLYQLSKYEPKKQKTFRSVLFTLLLFMYFGTFNSAQSENERPLDVIDSAFNLEGARKCAAIEYPDIDKAAGCYLYLVDLCSNHLPIKSSVNLRECQVYLSKKWRLNMLRALSEMGITGDIEINTKKCNDKDSSDDAWCIRFFLERKSILIDILNQWRLFE